MRGVAAIDSMRESLEILSAVCPFNKVSETRQ